MIGIVLWRDQAVGKAVIWCEDQGDLAFYTQSSGEAAVDLRVGDWVAFDLILEDNTRVARDVSLLGERGCPGLVDDLVAASADARPKRSRAAQECAPDEDCREVALSESEAADVILFDRILEERRKHGPMPLQTSLLPPPGTGPGAGESGQGRESGENIISFYTARAERETKPASGPRRRRR